jgi:hypothetical protein
MCTLNCSGVEPTGVDPSVARRCVTAGVIYRKDAYLPPVARRFIEILKKTAKEIRAAKP